jgi:L,D-transpeptidase YcbB
LLAARARDAENRAAVEAAREEVTLPKEVPVACNYLTAWMNQFRSDVYAQDEQLLEATAEEAAFFNQAANHPLTAHLAQ